MAQIDPAVTGPVESSVMQHTPGPWQCSARPSGPWWHIGAGNQSVCTVHACSKKHTPVYAAMFKANADLIAAAPELLAALQALRRAREQDKYPSWEKGVPEFNKAEAMADAAIAKAVGRAA